MPDSFELAGQINDLYRRSRLNLKYYGNRQRYYQRVNLSLETAIAVGTSAAVASAFGSGPAAHVCFYSFGIIAALATASKPVWNLTSTVARYAGLRNSYFGIHARIERLARQMVVEKTVPQSAEREYDQINSDFEAIERNDDPDPDRRLSDQLNSEVLKELPVDRLFWPTTSPA